MSEASSSPSVPRNWMFCPIVSPACFSCVTSGPASGPSSAKKTQSGPNDLMFVTMVLKSFWPCWALSLLVWTVGAGPHRPDQEGQRPAGPEGLQHHRHKHQVIRPGLGLLRRRGAGGGAAGDTA